ncbi:UL36 very large tegument protein [Streptomyces sp. NPDC012637]|uniref:UL36 very large tegument protein n=1 Tax=Streptomyces sp. NPDC012637 TaxID=3364842 RepID=UPI0036E3429E
MTVHQLPAEVAAFTGWLSELAGRLDPGRGWYGVFADRDPEGMRACFDGTDILPWDVVESLLQDLGEPADGPRGLRGRALHRAAAAVHDGGPGGAAALLERRDLMEREARYAESRIRDLAGTTGHAAALSWARDDLTRARARVTELTERLDRIGGTDRSAPVPPAAPSALTRPTPPAAPTLPASPAEPAPRPRRRPRGARYAYVDEAEALPVPEPLPAPELPVGPAAAPRGARFGGAPVSAAPAAGPAAPAGDPAQAARAAGNAVYALRRLRAQGRSGDAHALLCEALAGPPGWLPVLAAELHAAGLGADWATLLWEAATLPPARLAAVAGALADAGRPHDCEQLLRQGVARPVEELAGACAALCTEGHRAEAQALLAAFLRARTPEDAARLAAADPAVLVPGLLAAARAASPARERDLAHALRVAGLA